MENAVRLKFKKSYHESDGPYFTPKGYRLATVEEIRKKLEIFKSWELPIKKTRYSLGTNIGDRVRLLDGWMSAHSTDGKFQLHEGPSFGSRWTAVVKKKVWESSEGNWRNCSDLYSSNGNSLRKQLYNGITLSTQRMEIAWFHAYFYEDVELLYWLWQKKGHSMGSDRFTSECRGEHIQIDIDHDTPLRKMVKRFPGSGFQLQMGEAQMLLMYAIKSRSHIPAETTWEVAMVELFIEIYGQAFVKAVAGIAFEKEESVPIFTKLLSVCLDQPENQNQLEKKISASQYEKVLIEAVERGYSLLVSKMLESKEDIARITADNPVRVLKVAIGGGDTELVKSLINLLNVSKTVEKDDEGKTLFHYALPHAEVFDLLRAAYADSYHDIITTQDRFGRSILHWAAKGAYDSRVVDGLLEISSVERSLGFMSSAECLILSRDNQGRTPLHIAASKGDSRMIGKLVSVSLTSQKRSDYIQATDSSGQTALQMAAGEGHPDSVKSLINWGSDPLQERDNRRKTALHHAAQVKDPRVALATCKTLVESVDVQNLDPEIRDDDKRNQLLLLWASAPGIGTADEMEDVHHLVKSYLEEQKEQYKQHLLRAAALNNNAEMAWELLNRGADMADILDPDWRKKLTSSKQKSVENVISHIERMKEQGRDQPTLEDKLGRHVFAEGLAALLLNRFIESPITVGIFGEWGMGKSSLMFQTEKILLVAAAQLTFPNLLPSEQFVGAKKISLSTRGRKIYQQIKRGAHNLLALSKDKPPKEIHLISLCTKANKICQQISRWAHNFLTPSRHKSENPLVTMLKEYQPRYHAVYKSLACMDNTQMLQSKSVSQQQGQALRGVPRILTIQYNAWHYRDRNEAWAGLGVTITKEIEKAMTRAQWLSTCWRFSWDKHRANIWIQVFLPCLFSIFLGGWIAWIVWMLLKQAKFQGLKYGSIPFTVIAISWVVLKSVISVVKPVSTQMLGYITSPNHTSHLGYQENVIEDINFLKKELGKKPHWFFSFILGLWCWNWFGLCADNIENTRIPKFMPASEDQIRIVTFVDDLDRCEEKVILQVLSAVNLVLAECKINVILGIDRKMIERAIRRNFEDVDDADLAEKFICKIIQIPLSLPDPTEQQSNRFLEYHLGHKIPGIEKKSSFKSQRGIVIEDIEETNFPPSQPEPEEGCRGITNWLGCLFKFTYTVACNISTELRQPYDKSVSLRSAEGVKLIGEILLPNYTEEEALIFYELSKFASGNQKLPREWKRLLNYHKFAWYVIFRTGNIYDLPQWKSELIGWIFACWQWKHEMNHLIKNWQKYKSDLISKQKKDGKERHCRDPLLSEIVAECMDQLNISQSSENVAESSAQLNISQSPEPERSNTTDRQEGFMKLRGSLKQDPSMKAILCLFRDNDRINEQGTSQDNWRKLQEALKIRDVSMEAIQNFQQFRLYCETDHLPWP